MSKKPQVYVFVRYRYQITSNTFEFKCNFVGIFTFLEFFGKLFSQNPVFFRMYSKFHNLQSTHIANYEKKRIYEFNFIIIVFVLLNAEISQNTVFFREYSKFHNLLYRYQTK